MRIYLAGPIEQCSADEIKLWRDYVKKKLIEHQIVEPEENLSDSLSIFKSNIRDVENTDLTFAFLPKNINSRRVSYGTIFEISYAYSIGKKVFIISDDSYVHNHPVMKQIGNHFFNLDDAIKSI